MRSSNDPSGLGTKLGPRLVHIISDTIAATKLKLLDTEHRARVISMQEIIDRAGHEIADLYRPVWEETLAQQDMPDVIRDHMGKIMSGRHQWQAIAGIAFGASGAPSAISQIVSNYLAPAVRATLQASPELVPPVNDWVNMFIRGVVSQDEVLFQAAGQGYNNDVTQRLIDAARGYPDVSTTLEMLRRNMILPQDAGFYLNHNGISPDVIPLLLQLQQVIVSAPDLADMVVRGIRTQADATAAAKLSGVPPSDFTDMVLLTGEPPGLEQMLEGYRRKFIDQQTLERGIRESRYRDEWIPLLEALRYSPMSVADAVNAVVQNHLTADEGAAIADQNGLAPGSFDILQQTAGEPLSRTEMEELYNRGLVTQEQVNQALRESRVKDKYIDLAFQLHRRVMPIFTLQKAVKAGAVDHATAVEIAMESGYSQRDAEIIVSGGSSDKLLAYKNKVVSSIASLYENNGIGQQDAIALITGLGFDDTEAQFIVQAAEFRRAEKVMASLSGAVRSRYVSRHIDRVAASGDLDSVGVPASQRDFLLALWDIELDANTRHLTEAQIVKAVNKNLITPDVGQARLVAMGYSADDASLLLQGA